MATGCTRLVVAAIDFGTTYSGYAFSFRDKPMEVRTNQSWSQRLVSMKTPTSVLIDPEGAFHSFGYDAEEHYSTLCEDEEAEGWALFRRFKMLLHNNPDLNSDTEIEDISKTAKLPARTVFAMAIRYMKDHILNSLSRKKTKNDPLEITQNDVFFVVTVPTIWDDLAKAMMREAAIEAGIDGDQLAIALESEAASVWCRTFPITNTGEECPLSEPGTQYMVCDIGGGTADITVHESRRDGKLHELTKASGGYWGGTQVDKCFVHMLTTVMGKDVMAEFSKNNVGDKFELLKSFETTKRTLTAKSEGMMSFKIPASLREVYEEKHGKIRNVPSTEYGDQITVKQDKMRVHPNLARTLFNYSINSLVGHILNLLEQPQLKRVSTLLFVGGFSECPLVHDAVHEHLSHKNLVFPFEGGLTVLKGAVLYGHTPGIVATRIARFTYGMKDIVDYDPAIHKKKVYINKVAKCDVAFKKYVEVGQEVTVGHTINETDYPDRLEQRKKEFCLYISNEPNPVLVTERGCTLLGKLNAPLPRKGRTLEERSFQTSIVFGDTEILFQIKHDDTGQIHNKYFNFR